MKIALLVLYVYITLCAVVLAATEEEMLMSLESEMDKELAKLMDIIGGLDEWLDDSAPANTKTNYVRWGRTVCPSRATLLYKGYMGKSWHALQGGGGNYVCLASVPGHPDNADATMMGGSKIYGVAYQTKHTFPNSNLIDHYAACAVCVVNKIQKLMIPGKKTCYTGWTMEYTGVLMSEHNGHGKCTYLCVDKVIEAMPSGSADTNGFTLYYVEADCAHGTLACPPYGVEVACVVCTK